MDGYKNQDVTVTPYRQNGEVKWRMTIESSGKSGGPGNYPVLEMPANRSAKIKIEIDNPDGFNYKFAKDSNALWVTTGTADPTQPATVPDQIPVGSIQTKDDDTELHFVNLNKGDPVTLRYTLNFVSNGQPSSTLDPVIQNTGGGGGGGFQNYAWYAVAGVLAVLLLAVLFQRTFLKKAAASPPSDDRRSSAVGTNSDTDNQA